MKIVQTLAVFLAIIFFAQAEIDSFKMTRQGTTYAVTNDINQYFVDLPIDSAFLVESTFNPPEGSNVTSFCQLYPSSIWGELTDSIYSDQYNFKEYDNIIEFRDYHFLLHSTKLSMLAYNSPKNGAQQFVIPSKVSNTMTGNTEDTPWLVLNREGLILYIITNDHIYLYDIAEFLNAIGHNKTIPAVQTAAIMGGIGPFNHISLAAFYHDNLYIVADNVITIYKSHQDGQVFKYKVLDAEFIGKEQVSFVDASFQGDYLFALDSISGVKIIDISQINSIRVFPGLNIDIDSGDFVEVLGDSINVVVNGKNPYVSEYVIADFETMEIVHNRNTDLFEAIRDIYSDYNNIFMITGFVNLASKHSIPSRFDIKKEDMIYIWVALRAKDMIIADLYDFSEAYVLTDDAIMIFEFYNTQPYMVCNPFGIPDGEYSYDVVATQKECDWKILNPQSDYNTVCIVEETYTLIVGSDNQKVGNVEKQKDIIAGLGGGVLLFFLLVVVFCICACKYKRKHRYLEDQIKFKQVKSSDDNSTAQQQNQA